MGNVMKKINEHYYAITEDEITSEMERIENGLYLIGEDFYEVRENAEEQNSPDSQVTKPTRTYITRVVSTGSRRPVSNSTLCFVFSVLLLAFSVLCFYTSINYFVVNNEIKNANAQLTPFLISVPTDDLVINGVLWLVGGIITIIVGIVLAVIYNNNKRR